MAIKNIFLVVIFIATNIFCQNEINNDSLSINYKRAALIGGVTAAAFVYGYGIQNNMWWKGEKSDFHFNWKNDWNYARGADKIGHCYFGYLVSSIYNDAFTWSGIEKDKSALYSGIFTLSYQTFLEVRDGFSKKYGFSWGDFTANLLGSFFMIMKSGNKFLNDFDVKVSYYPSQKFKDGSNKYIIDDYESTYNWFSVNVKNLLPVNTKKYFPSFVNLALGHGVKRIDESDSYHELFFSLDWNLEFIKSENWLIKILKYINKYYHFPAPAIKVYPDVVWYGIKF
ncbi:MAG: DUF2279 domain-containing protein [Melioribacteraceae bacterium]|nr:DUF2279 domain-containing protein [Melioribacteraceae bacterium]